MSLLFGIFLFLLLSAIFSGTEIAFFSANKLQLELKKLAGSKRSRIIDQFYEKPADFLGILLVGNNIALVIFTMLATSFLELNLPINNEIVALLSYTLITTVVVLIFGEFLPKTLFRLYADRILFSMAYVLHGIRFVLWLPAWLMIKLSNWLIGLIASVPEENAERAFTRLDLEKFIETSTTSIEEEIDKTLFHKALQLHGTRIRDCMVPRPEISYIDVEAEVSELEALIKESNLSRIIVTNNNEVDDIVGYVHHQQLFKDRPDSIKSILRDIIIVPETMLAQDVMTTFIKSRTNIACVVDEFGGTAGIVTLEDILEELFGEIEDEHDKDSGFVEEQISEREFRFSGRLELNYLNEKYNILHFPEGEYHTLSGYLVMTTESIPEQGDTVVLGDYEFVLELVTDTKIETVRVVLPKEEEL